MNLLKQLQTVTFHRAFVDVTGSINAALMLSNAVYWTNKLPSERDGWFHKSREEWLIEIGLDRRELDTARRVLESLGILETRRAKLPNAGSVTGLWHRINVDALAKRLETVTNGTKRTFGNGTDRTDQWYESAHCSPFKEKNIDYTSSPPPQRARAIEKISEGWLPNECVYPLLAAEGIAIEFAVSCLPEFRLYWIQRGDVRADWDSVFARQVRQEFAYRQNQEARRHERLSDRANLPGRVARPVGRPRKETLADRCARYDRFAAGLDASLDGGNAPSAAYDAISGDFRPH